MREKKRRPAALGDVIGGFLRESGLAKRVEQASAVDDWAAAAGPQIAAVSTALSVTPDGTLFVAVATHAWMTELSLLEPELLAALNRGEGRQRVRKIRFRLRG
jgi:predicted nucleic acid-binding Zn ribbon protein